MRMYTVSEVVVLDRNGEESTAYIYSDDAAVVLVIPTTKRFLAVLPLKDTEINGKKVKMWGYEEGLRWIRDDELEELAKQGRLNELMSWGIDHEDERAA